MAKRCEICGKGPAVGNNVSHAKNRTRRRFMPNLHATKLLLKGQMVKVLACTRCIRTQSKAAR